MLPKEKMKIIDEIETKEAKSAELDKELADYQINLEFINRVKRKLQQKLNMIKKQQNDLSSEIRKLNIELDKANRKGKE